MKMISVSIGHSRKVAIHMPGSGLSKWMDQTAWHLDHGPPRLQNYKKQMFVVEVSQSTVFIVAAPTKTSGYRHRIFLAENYNGNDEERWQQFSFRSQVLCDAHYRECFHLTFTANRPCLGPILQLGKLRLRQIKQCGKGAGLVRGFCPKPNAQCLLCLPSVRQLYDFLLHSTTHPDIWADSVLIWGTQCF